MTEKTLTPFLKWAGGKRWLVEKHDYLLVDEYNRFIEPFLGSGAVFFNLRPKVSILSDKNERLIEVYSAIKNDWRAVQDSLRVHHESHSKEYYYRMRSAEFDTVEDRAAQFIYLNRTCWNGLYRVNLKGRFNVPIGTKKYACLATDDFERVAAALHGSTLIAGDFEWALNEASCGDFVFVDPPYTVKHNYNGFVKYNESIFSWEDQIRLRDAVKAAVGRGAQVLVTNAFHESIRCIYEGLGELIKLNRPSVISGKSSGRGVYEEMVIKCY